MANPSTSEHFAQLGLSPAFELDEAALRRSYFDAQSKEHPDRLPDAASRLRAIQHSADINVAYRILADPLSRAEYLLARDGIRLDGEGATRANQSILLESLEWREALAESTEPDGFLPGIDAAIAESTGLFAASWESDPAQAAQAVIRWRFFRKLRQEASARAAALPEE